MKRVFMCFVILAMTFLMGCSKETFAPNDTTSNDATDVAEDNRANAEIEIKNEFQIRKEKIDSIIEDMTIDEKVGQLIMAAYRTDDTGVPITQMNDYIKNDIENYNLGGVIIFSENMTSKEQISDYINEIKSLSKMTPFIVIDEEGGRVSRIKSSGIIEGYEMPSAEEMFKNGTVSQNYDTIGDTLYKLGFNMDFAPVADINTNPENIVIGDRAFGKTPIEVSGAVSEAIKSLEKHNIIPVLKHFPGHGDTFEDSHKGETIVNHNIDRLMNTEFVPFINGFNSGADAVMVAHIKMPEISDKDIPASLNPDIINGLLRDELGFQGVVFTDALDMKAITDYYANNDAALMAIDAGVDIIVMAGDVSYIHKTIIDALNSGKITEERINQSLERILKLKYDNNLLWNIY